MKALRDFLDEKDSSHPVKGTLGKQTGWFHLMDMELLGDHFLVCDFQFIPSKKDGMLIKASPGLYSLEAAGVDFGGDRRIARLRIIQKGVAGKPGKTIGETWTDTACTSVCDFKKFSKEWNAAGENSAGEKLQNEYEKGEDCGIFQLDKGGVVVPYVSSGFGDGTFPVFELCKGSKRSGFEIEFIATDEPYPFGPIETAPPLTEAEKASQEFRDETWEKFGELLQSHQKEKKGNKPADRKKLEEKFASFMKGLENDALSEVRKLREHYQQVRRKLLPLTVEYRPMVDVFWLSEKQVAARISALESAGFLKVGCFQPATLSSSRVGFIHAKEGCAASVIKTNFKVSLHIGYGFEDKTEDEFTDLPTTNIQVIPPWLHYVSRPDLSPCHLIDFASRERRQGVLKPATADNYATESAEAWVRLVAWRSEMGGYPAKYFKERFGLTDSPEDTDKLQMMRRDEADKSLCNWLCLQSDLSFRVDEVLGDLVIVHDELTPSLLNSAWWCGTNDIHVKEEEFAGSNPRKVFAEINHRRGNKLRLVLEKRTGFPADYYLPAED